MQILLFNCLERIKRDLTRLLQSPEVSVYLSVSKSDIIRILNSTHIDIAMLSIPDIDTNLLNVLHAYKNTKFYFFGTPSSMLTRYDNLHAVGMDYSESVFQPTVMPECDNLLP